jgi:hypothetical protein
VAKAASPDYKGRNERNVLRRGAVMNDNDFSIDLAEASAAKRAALSYVVEAFVEAQLDGLDADCMAQAALFAAFQELVATYGEEATAHFAEGLPERIRVGAFSTTLRH